MNKSDIIKNIIEIEGGYVDNSSDSGRKTKYGITEKVARVYGYEGDMKDLSYEVAFEIYEKEYWNKMKLDNFPFSIAEKLMDIGVNMGVKRAGEFLQRALNSLGFELKIDGIIGNQTLCSFGALYANRQHEGVKVMLEMLKCLQGEFYIELTEKRPKDKRFIYGWFKNRIMT